MRGCRERRSEPQAKPSELNLRVENTPVRIDRGLRGWVSVPVRTPVDQFSFRDRETHTQAGAFGLKYSALPLQQLDVLAVRLRRDRQGEVVHIGEGEAMWDLAMET